MPWGPGPDSLVPPKTINRQIWKHLGLSRNMEESQEVAGWFQGKSPSGWWFRAPISGNLYVAILMGKKLNLWQFQNFNSCVTVWIGKMVIPNGKIGTWLKNGVPLAAANIDHHKSCVFNRPIFGVNDLSHTLLVLWISRVADADPDPHAQILFWGIRNLHSLSYSPGKWQFNWET